MTELYIYEKNLSQMISEYEKLYANYLNSVRLEKNGGPPAATALLKLSSLNQDIVFLLEEIFHKINNNNSNNKKYKDEKSKKRDDLNVLNDKMRADEAKINALLNNTISLDGKNETLRLKTKSSMYYNTINVILIVILCILFARVITSSETDLTETVVLLLGLIWLFYSYRVYIISWLSYIKDFIGNITYSLLYRLLD